MPTEENKTEGCVHCTQSVSINKVLRTLTDVQLRALLNKNSQTQLEKKAKLAKQRLKYALNERYYQD